MKRIRCKVSGRLLKIQTESFQASGSFGGRIKAPFVLSVSFFLFPPHPPVPFFRQQKTGSGMVSEGRSSVFFYALFVFLCSSAASAGDQLFHCREQSADIQQHHDERQDDLNGNPQGTSKIMMNACTSSSTVLQINRNAPIFIWINRRVSNARSRNTTR